MPYLHRHTWPELLQIKDKTPIADVQGYLWTGPDRKGPYLCHLNDLWVLWLRDIGRVLSIRGESACDPAGGVKYYVPQNVMDYFQTVKGLAKPPTGDETTHPGTKLLKAAPPRFTWSYTSMQEFLTCPYQWAAKRYFKTLKEEQSEAMLWGSRVHKAFENAVNGKPEAGDNEIIEQVGGGKYVQAFLGARAKGATVMAEQQLALNASLTPCDWFAKDAYGRGVLDVSITSGNTIKIYDYKTGKTKDDQLQLRVFCAFAAQHYSHIENFDAKFIWLKDDKITGLERPLTRAEIPVIWGEIIAVVDRMKAAWDSANFRMQTNGLCKAWCGATDCPHCGKGGK